MVLKNLITIADKSLPMALFSERKDGTRKRYNFQKDIWDETLLTNEKIINIGDFCKTRVYKAYQECELITWSTLKAKNIKENDIDDAKRIVSISIKLV